MANTHITLTNDRGTLVPSQPSVPVYTGDTVSFSTIDGSPAFLFFSPAAIAVLSPAPTGPTEVSSTPVTFTFTSSSLGEYSVFFETTAGSTTPDFPVRPSNLLMLEIDPSGVHFGGPIVDSKG